MYNFGRGRNAKPDIDKRHSFLGGYESYSQSTVIHAAS